MAKCQNRNHMHRPGNRPCHWTLKLGGGYCHDLLISVHNYLTFSLYSPSLYLLVLQAKYFVICINLQAWHLSTLPIDLFIGPSLYHHYLLQGPLQCLSSVPETSKICLQGQVAFYLTLTTSDAGLNIWN